MFNHSVGIPTDNALLLFIYKFFPPLSPLPMNASSRVSLPMPYASISQAVCLQTTNVFCRTLKINVVLSLVVL